MARTDFIASLDTEVPVTRSVAAIQELVEKFGARSFQTTYSRTTGSPEAIRFSVVDPNVEGAPEFTVELTAPADVSRKELVRRAKRALDPAQVCARAERIAWRHLHDFVRASLIGVQDGLLTVGEAFLANLVVTGPDGHEQRFSEVLTQQGLLTPADGGRLLLGKGAG